MKFKKSSSFVFATTVILNSLSLSANAWKGEKLAKYKENTVYPTVVYNYVNSAIDANLRLENEQDLPLDDIKKLENERANCIKKAEENAKKQGLQIIFPWNSLNTITGVFDKLQDAKIMAQRGKDCYAWLSYTGDITDKAQENLNNARDTIFNELRAAVNSAKDSKAIGMLDDNSLWVSTDESKFDKSYAAVNSARENRAIEMRDDNSLWVSTDESKFDKSCAAVNSSKDNKAIAMREDSPLWVTTNESKFNKSCAAVNSAKDSKAIEMREDNSLWVTTDESKKAHIISILTKYSELLIVKKKYFDGLAANVKELIEKLNAMDDIAKIEFIESLTEKGQFTKETYTNFDAVLTGTSSGLKEGCNIAFNSAKVLIKAHNELKEEKRFMPNANKIKNKNDH